MLSSSMLEIETNLKLVCHFLTTPQKSLKLPSAWKCICSGTIFVLMRQLKDLALKRLKSYELFLAKVHCTCSILKFNNIYCFVFQWILPEMVAHGVITVLLLGHFQWIFFLLNAPLLGWHVYRWVWSL